MNERFEDGYWFGWAMAFARQHLQADIALRRAREGQPGYDGPSI